jgi:hypothetical protein
MTYLKKRLFIYMVMRCKSDDHYAHSKYENNTMIEETLFVEHSLKVIKVIILIINASYLVGMTWLIILEYIEIEIKKSDYKTWTTEQELKEKAFIGESFKGNFLTEYGLYLKHPMERVIMVSYFAFTSLSTVGFGDMHP